MLLLVPVPERSTAKKSCPASPPGLIVSPNSKLPPRLTWVTRSKVGVTPPFCALLERIHQNGLPKFAPPIKRLPFVSTSSVPHTGELGILIGFIQVTPPSVALLNCLQPITILLRFVGSTAIDGSFAASPRMLFPLASTLTWKLVNGPYCEIIRGEVSIRKRYAGGMLYFSSGSVGSGLCGAVWPEAMD